MKRRWFADALRAGRRAGVWGLSIVLALSAGPVLAGDLSYTIVPATFSPAIAKVRAATPPAQESTPALTPELLQAYVQRQRQLKAFDGFDVPAPGAALNETVLLGYLSAQRNQALVAIAQADRSPTPVLTPDLLAQYAQDQFVPTAKKVKHAKAEQLCLAQAIYHEARGEPETGQLAVANIIVNRAMSKKYPATICGVVFQNADAGLYRCQFTFACDGRSDMGTERKAWARASRLATAAYRKFQHGKQLGVIPGNALFYHTTAVNPSWSSAMRRVAAIGAHVFYAAN